MTDMIRCGLCHEVHHINDFCAPPLSASTASPTEQSALPRDTIKPEAERPSREEVARIIDPTIHGEGALVYWSDEGKQAAIRYALSKADQILSLFGGAS